MKEEKPILQSVLYPLESVGRYAALMRIAFRKAEKRSVYWKQISYEMYELGIRSLPFVLLVSIFVGAVVALQTANNITSPFIPTYLVGFATRESILLEFSPTIISLLLAGKVGSYISSGIGTMRVKEQIDALEIMGINSAGYLIFPKIIALVILNPVIIVFSMVLGVAGGWIACVAGNVSTSADFIYGIRLDFSYIKLAYSLIKTVIFAFLIATVPAYFGFYTSGGALGIGKASTKAVVTTSVLIIVFNLLITNIFL